MNTPAFNSVWEAIEDTPQQAANWRARSALMMALENRVNQQHLTLPEAAQCCGVTQPRMADLLQGKIHQFSLDALMAMATTAGLFPRIVMEPAPRQTTDAEWRGRGLAAR